MEPRLPALGVQSGLWTTREVPLIYISLHFTFTDEHTGNTEKVIDLLEVTE